MTDDELFAAAVERVLQVLPPTIGQMMAARIKYGDDVRIKRHLAEEIMAMPGKVVTREQVEAGARRIGEFHGREFQRHLDVPLTYQIMVDAGLNVEGV